MGRNKVEKTSEQIEIEDLIDAHGKQFVKLCEIECKIMRVDGQIENGLARGLNMDDRQAVVSALGLKQSAMVFDMQITVKAIERLTGTVAPPWSKPVERDVTPYQASFLLN